MAPHVVKRGPSVKNWPTTWISSQQHRAADMNLPHDYLYDLYAVCNHHGGMHGGHYTGTPTEVTCSTQRSKGSGAVGSTQNNVVIITIINVT